MPLDLGGGDFNDIRWMAQDQTWRANGEDIDLKFAVFDLENIKIGWVSFQQGTAPEVEWDNGAKGPRPHTDAEWKRGFEVEVYAPKTFGDGAARTFLTSATGACMGIQAIYVEYEKQREANPGKVPLCKFTGSEAIKVGKGSTSVPQLTISKWIERGDFIYEEEEMKALKKSAAPAKAVLEEKGDDAEF